MSNSTTEKETRKRRKSLATLISRWLERSAQLSPSIRLKIIEALVVYTTTGIVPKLKPIYQVFLESVIEAPAKPAEKTPSETDSTTTTTTSISYNNNNKTVSGSSSTDAAETAETATSGNARETVIPGSSVTPKPIPDRADVSAYFRSKGFQPDEADAQAQAFIDFNEARDWKIGNNKVKSVSQWKWLAQRWISGMASHPSPLPVAPSPQDQERRRQEQERAVQVERKRIALNDLWTKVRNNLCAIFTPKEYMEIYHEIQPVSFTADGTLTIRVPGGPKARALTADYRPALDDAIRSAFPGAKDVVLIS